MKKLTGFTFATFFVVSLAACSSSDDDPLVDIAPVDDSPANGPSVGDTPVADTPVADVPVDDMPVADMPVDDMPVADMPVDDMPVADMPVDEMPVDEMPVDEMPVDEMPVDEMPVDEMPVDEMPVDEMPVDEMPVDEMPVDEMPVSGFVPDTDAFYVLQTQQSIEAGQCFESNFVAPESFLGGASHMTACGFFSGQLWRFIDQGNGFYQLQSAFLEGTNQCLEGNRFAAEADLGGAAFMSDCVGATGQSWALLDQGNDTFQLQTQFREEENECLEGNQVSDTATLGGAAFMVGCDQVTGQIWSATLSSEFQF